VDHSLSGLGVFHALELRQRGSQPQYIVCDTGREFTGKVLD
jgi:hypothetical protein